MCSPSSSVFHILHKAATDINILLLPLPPPLIPSRPPSPLRPLLRESDTKGEQRGKKGVLKNSILKCAYHFYKNV